MTFLVILALMLISVCGICGLAIDMSAFRYIQYHVSTDSVILLTHRITAAH